MRFAKAIKQGKLSSNEVGMPPRLHKHLNSHDKTIQTRTFDMYEQERGLLLFLLFLYCSRLLESHFFFGSRVLLLNDPLLIPFIQNRSGPNCKSVVDSHMTPIIWQEHLIPWLLNLGMKKEEVRDNEMNIS